MESGVIGVSSNKNGKMAVNLTMRVKEIWRYPIKTMAGEKLRQATIGQLGIDGDRIVHVEDSHGRYITSRSHPRFLALKGTLNRKKQPLVNGRMWNSPEVTAEVETIVGRGAKLVRYDGVERFDVLPLLVATDSAIAAFGYDHRRLRPNIVIGGVKGMAERNWPGGCLHIGKVIIGIQDLRMRCIMTSYDPDTQEQNKEITRGIYRRFEGKLALNCFVIQGGKIAVGDKVLFTLERACSDSTFA